LPLTSIAGTFHFTATGTADGPYAGPFTETGSVTVGADGALTAFTASFTISAPSGTVTGTKTLTSGTERCIVGQTVDATAQLTYQATITTPAGVAYTDQGASSAFVRVGVPLTQTTNLNESFTSSLAAPVALATTPPVITPHRHRHARCQRLVH